MEPTLKVAKKYPNVHFEHATGYKRDKNMSTYSGRFYEGRYIQGIIAAKMSKAGVLGYIGSFPIPEVISGINATMLGAQTINPNIKVKIIWANTWFDPGKEADAAKALLDQGADVIMQHTDSPAAMQIASERGKLAFGQDSEMIKFGPKTQLTSIMDNWAPYYIERVKAELDGTWKSEDIWGGLKTKMVVMAPYTNMPDDVKKLAMDTEAAITDGKLHPFKCPVIGQDGKEVECKGGDPSRRRPDARHELLRQGHRRQDSRQVSGRALAATGSGRQRPDPFVCELDPASAKHALRSWAPSSRIRMRCTRRFTATDMTHPACIARAAALWRRIRSGTSRPGIAPSVTTHCRRPSRGRRDARRTAPAPPADRRGRRSAIRRA